MVLDRLLRSVHPASYCLISAARGVSSDISRLSAEHHRLEPSFRLPVPNDSFLFTGPIALNAWSGIRGRARQIVDIIRTNASDVLLACSGDLYDLPAASVASQRSGVRLVAYMFDDYRFQWTGAVRALAFFLERHVMTRASAIIVPNEFLAREYSRRYHVPVCVVRNPSPLPDLGALDAMGTQPRHSARKIVFTGSVYHAHFGAFRDLIAAMRSMRRPEVTLHIYCPQSSGELCRNGVCGPMVVHHPHVDPALVPSILRRADILFLPLALDSPVPEVIRTSSPGKMGEYLAIGRPTLVYAPSDSYVSWYFRGHDCGVVVDAGSQQRLSTGLASLLDDQTLRDAVTARARARAEIDFTVDHATVQLYQCLNAVVSGHGRP